MWNEQSENHRGKIICCCNHTKMITGEIEPFLNLRHNQRQNTKNSNSYISWEVKNQISLYKLTKIQVHLREITCSNTTFNSLTMGSLPLKGRGEKYVFPAFSQVSFSLNIIVLPSYLPKSRKFHNPITYHTPLSFESIGNSPWSKY